MNTIQGILALVTLCLLAFVALGLVALARRVGRLEGAASSSATDLGRMVERGLVLVPATAVKIHRPPVRVEVLRPSLTLAEIASSAGRPVPTEDTPIPASVERRRGRLLLLDQQ